MWRGAAVALCAVGCSQPQAAPSTSDTAAPPPTATVEVAPPASSSQPLDAVEALITLEVEDAIVADDRLLVLEPGSLVVSARSLTDGSALWSSPFQESATGAHLLQRLASGRVLVRSGDKLTVIDGDGALVAQHAVPTADRMFLWERDGACGLRGQCSMQLIDCATAKPLGSAVQGQIRSRRSFDGNEHHSGCWAFDLSLVGRSGGVVVYFVHNAAGTGADTAFGVDSSDGGVRWRSTAFGCPHCLEPQYGMSPDGKHCWTWSNDELVDFDCRTGRVRWSRRAGEPRMAIWAGDESGGIFVSSGNAALLHDPGDGKPRWTRMVGTEVVALPAQGKLTPLVDVLLSDVEASRLVLLNVADGTPAEHRGAARGTVTTDPDGSVGLRASAPERDHTGQVIPTMAPPTLTVERGRRVGSGKGPPNSARVRRGEEVIDEIADDAWLLGEVRHQGALYAAVMVARTPREVRVYRVSRAPR